MVFDLDLVASTVTILYVKMPIADLFAYLGFLAAAYKNYKKNMDIHEAQIERNTLAAEESAKKRRMAKIAYIKDHAKAYFLEIEKLSKQTENPIDDKLCEYVRKFKEGFSAVFEEEPEAHDVETMKKFAEVHAHEEKLLKGDDNVNK